MDTFINGGSGELPVPVSASDCRAETSVTTGSPPNIDIMTPTGHTLVACVVFLCGLQETLSQRGHCSGDRCSALFQKPEDAPGALKVCSEIGGRLLSVAPGNVSAGLFSGINGSYWLDVPGTGSTGADPVNCSSVSLMMGHNFTFAQKPCGDKLDGFLCEYTLGVTCTRVPEATGTQVKYATPTGSEAEEYAVFPGGTIATVVEVGGDYLLTRHLCYTSWLPAPWTCEVMQGGCEHACNSTKTCICPAGQTLHPNNITCTKDPCVDCAHQCHKVGDSHVCTCDDGYRLAQDGKSCVDINECVESSPCTGEGEECVNLRGRFECRCMHNFYWEEGACVNVSICQECEHRCERVNGVYECVCRRGFTVSQQDPTMCEMSCTEQDCLAHCIPNPELEAKGIHQCYCPPGYITDPRNNTSYCTDINECEIERQCDQKCENLFGGYRCVCHEGFRLHDDTCVPLEEDEGASGSSPPSTKPASAPGAAVPSYVKTGSVLGITVFMVLCFVLMCCLIRNMLKRCGRLELSSIKGPDMDIFYLQQVTTETYKRLSLDKPFKNDSQRL